MSFGLVPAFITWKKGKKVIIFTRIVPAGFLPEKKLMCGEGAPDELMSIKHLNSASKCFKIQLKTVFKFSKPEIKFPPKNRS
jgi:hypothetical protein